MACPAYRSKQQGGLRLRAVDGLRGLHRRRAKPAVSVPPPPPAHAGQGVRVVQVFNATVHGTRKATVAILRHLGLVTANLPCLDVHAGTPFPVLVPHVLAVALR